ncbi:MAG: hypothetical protein Q8Q37_01180 [bacterium]|nr:hypothetical protein [bacterium]
MEIGKPEVIRVVRDESGQVLLVEIQQEDESGLIHKATYRRINGKMIPTDKTVTGGRLVQSDIPYFVLKSMRRIAMAIFNKKNPPNDPEGQAALAQKVGEGTMLQPELF